MIGKAEVSAAGDNPRFRGTNLPAAGFPDDADAPRFEPARRYEEFYGARGAMENGLKQPVLDLEAARLSPHSLASNPLRLWLATCAYLLLERGRAIGGAGGAGTIEPGVAGAGELRAGARGRGPCGVRPAADPNLSAAVLWKTASAGGGSLDLPANLPICPPGAHSSLGVAPPQT